MYLFCSAARFVCVSKGGCIMKYESTKRAKYLLCFILLLVVEICIALFVRDRFIRPYVGDVLVTVLLCCLMRCVFPDKPRLLPLYVFLFSIAVELSQLLHLADRLGIKSGVLRSIIGATFDWMDILCYFIGCALFYAIEMLTRNHAEKTACSPEEKP